MRPQASLGEARRSLAALIILPRFSASPRSAMNSFMQSSAGPAWVGGPGGPNPGPDAAPGGGNGLPPPIEAPEAPLTGGNGEAALGAAWPGNGAGKAPWAKPWPAWAKRAAKASGRIKWRTIKAVPPARSNGRQFFSTRVFPIEERFACGLFTVPADT